MNSKRSKQLRKLALDNGIGYDSLKNLYNRLGRASEQEANNLKRKINENKPDTSKQEQTPAGSSNR